MKKDTNIVDLIQQMLERQTESDIKMLELEEKQMKLEERALEQEAQQRREDREF